MWSVIIVFSILSSLPIQGRRGRDDMVLGFTTTCVIIAYHH